MDMSFVTDFVVKLYGTGEEFKLRMDAEVAKTIELKEKLETLTGIPVKDQELVYDDMIMKDENPLLDVSLYNDMYRVILVRKSATYPKESVNPPEDWNFEENPLYKPMTRYFGDNYQPADIRKLAYHIVQYITELGGRVNLQHLDIVAESNLAKYEKFVVDRRKNYYDVFEKCWYLDRRLQRRDMRRKEAIEDHQAQVRARQQAQGTSSK